MKTFRKRQKESFTNLEALLTFLEVSQESRKKFTATHFPLLVPYRLAVKMRKNDLNCPLLLQFLPQKKELTILPTCSDNPVGDLESRKTPKLIHKYPGRVLLTPTAACAMNCRYCFRRSYPYDKSASLLEEELAYIKKDTSLHEVILSGGDPLSLSDAKLSRLLFQIDHMPHIQLIRFHTRMPIGIPERITKELLTTLSELKTQVTFVLHVNHPKELDREIFAALKQLSALSIPILTQSVLLKGVNDNKEVLKELFLTLAKNGIVPYYLHQLDRVTGASHFEVPEEIGVKLINELRNEMPGYCVPRYVKEETGKKSKTLL